METFENRPHNFYQLKREMNARAVRQMNRNEQLPGLTNVVFNQNNYENTSFDQPLPIPTNADGRYMDFDTRSILIPTITDRYPMGIVEVAFMGWNDKKPLVPGLGVSTDVNYGQMILRTYNTAYEMARHRLYMHNLILNPGGPQVAYNNREQNWVTEMTQRHRTAPTQVHVGNDPDTPAVLARNNHLEYVTNPQGVPKVRIIINGIPLESEGNRQDVDLQSVTVRMPYNNTALAAKRLYTSITMQNFASSYNGLRKIGGEEYAEFTLIKGVRAQVTLKYIFMFVNKGATNVLSREEISVMSYPQTVIPRTRDVTRAQREETIFNSDLRGTIGTRAALNNVVRRVPGTNRTIAQDLGGAGAQSYQDKKERVYARKRISNFFTFSTAVMETPQSDLKLCFPMAFMRSECRMAKIHEGKVTEMFGGVKRQLTIPDDIQAPVLETKFWNPTTRKILLFENSKVASNKELRPGKTVPVYESYENEDVRRVWEWCALQIHFIVCDAWGEEIDQEDLGLCVQAYSHVFGVNLSVFHMELGRGKRIAFERSIHETNERFVTMMVDDNHCHAVSNVVEFIKNDFSINYGLCPFAVCDYCVKYNSAWKDGKHHNDCRLNKPNLAPEDEAEQMNHLIMKQRRRQVVDKKTGFKKMNICIYCGRFENQIPSCNCVGGGSFVLKPIGECVRCKQECCAQMYNYHDCYIDVHLKKKVAPLDEQSIWVYDIESMQIYNDKIKQYEHECILIYTMKAYDIDTMHVYGTIAEFVTHMISTKIYHGATILSHNGGAYDNLFLLRHLEKNFIAHATVPRPNSIHRFLKLTIFPEGGNNKVKITFTDFFMMFTASLKSIGAAFALPVCKGDFPHRFSKPEHLDYVGPMPQIDSPEDYYSIKCARSAEAREESLEYWTAKSLEYCYCHNQESQLTENQHTPTTEICPLCLKKYWNFRKELEVYCKLDVVVLAGAVRQYRDRALKFQGSSDLYKWQVDGIDPFHYMTQGQIALAMFVGGKPNYSLAMTFEKKRPEFSPAQIGWINADHGICHPNDTIIHAANHHKEWFDQYSQMYLDGFNKDSNIAYLYFKCLDWGCPTCYAEMYEANEFHAGRGLHFKNLYELATKKIRLISANMHIREVKVQWQHDDAPNWATDRANHIMGLRDFFYGGRTEVFAAYCDASKYTDKEILHLDVESLYPHCCSKELLPCGIPQVKWGKDIEFGRLNPFHSDPYFGFARVRIRPNKKDFIGILPQRRDFDGDEKLCFDLDEKEGCWFTRQIYLAMRQGYEILEIYEVWHYDANNRSDVLMRGYIEFFLRMKQEAEGWKKLGKDLYPNKKDWDNVSDAEQEAICEYIFMLNGGFARPRKENVAINPVMRQLAKIFLNCLWGKMCQRGAKCQEKFVFGWNEYISLLSDYDIDQETVQFRNLSGALYKAVFEYKDTIENNPFLNVAIAAAVTSHAQCILMEQMINVGQENMLYCDTDSVMCLRDKGAPPLHKRGIGNWTLEHVGETITHFAALAPKSYVICTSHGDELTEEIKCKGVTLTEHNREVVNFKTMCEVIDRIFQGRPACKKVDIGPKEYGAPLECKTMCIHPNTDKIDIDYATLLTRYGSKDVRAVYSKRVLQTAFGDEVLSDMKIVRLTPYGYDGHLGNERA